MRDLDPGAFVLPGHQLPFYGLRERVAELTAHHEARCAILFDACREKPHRPVELIPLLFSRKLDPHQMGFAVSELLAHVNYLVARGQLVWLEAAGEPLRLSAAA